MSNFSKIPNRTKIIALVAIFSALYAVLRIMQAIPMIGVSGGSFSLSDVLSPLYGIILGPYVGGASIILGTFLGMAMGKPVVFLGLDFLPALVNTVAIGFLLRRKWMPIVGLNIVLLLAFLINPVTLLFVGPVPFVWLHIVAIVVLISPLGRKAGQWVESQKPKFLTAGIAILAFVGTMMQHLMGSILFEVVFGQISGIFDAAGFFTRWNAIFFVYPVERFVLILLAVIIGVPLVKTLKKHISFSFEKQHPKSSPPSPQ